MFNAEIFYMVGILAVVAILSIIGLMSRYKKCKSDEILVVYGKTGNSGKSAKIIHGGGTFIWPIVQGYEYMSLKPMQLDCNLQGALSAQKIRVNVPTTITVAISTQDDIRQAAAERLLGLDQKSKNDLITDIVYGQMRLIIADMTIEELNNDREKLVENARTNIDEELRKFGLYLMNINISDIKDAADYIVNLGKEAESRAKNEAQANIAEQEKLGAIKVAEANKEREVRLAETNRDKEVSVAAAKTEQDSKVAEAESLRESRVAEAESKKNINVAESEKRAAVGRNLAEEEIAKSEAKLQVTQAQAKQEAETARAKAEAEVLRQKEIALTEAERARAEKVQQSLTAEKIVPAEIAKKEAVIKAEQVAEAAVKSSEGEAKAIELKAEAEAKAIRMKGEAEAAAKAASLQAEVDAYRGKLEAADAHPEIAVQMQIVDKVNYTEIAAEQRKAFEQMKLGNITIYDTGNGGAAGDFMKNLVDKVAPALGVMGSLPLPEKLSNFLKPATQKPKSSEMILEEKKSDTQVNQQEELDKPKTPASWFEPQTEVKFEPVDIMTKAQDIIDERLNKPIKSKKPKL